MSASHHPLSPQLSLIWLLGWSFLIAMVTLQMNLVAARSNPPKNLPVVRTVYFPQTGHHLSDRVGFLDFWRANGQLLTFGMPISEELVIDGRIVQYFERARFEYHPENAKTVQQVQLGLIGREWLAHHSLSLPPNSNLDTGAFFPETGYSLQGEFLEFWQRHGGLVILASH